MEYLAVDQYGRKIILETKHPRKELMELMGATYAQKMYVGEGTHIGWIVAGHWFGVMKLGPLTHNK